MVLVWRHLLITFHVGTNTISTCTFNNSFLVVVLLSSIPAWISNHTSDTEWDEITWPFLNVNRCPVELWDCNSLSRFMIEVIIYPCWDSNSPMLVKWVRFSCDRKLRRPILWQLNPHLPGNGVSRGAYVWLLLPPTALFCSLRCQTDKVSHNLYVSVIILRGTKY